MDEVNYADLNDPQSGLSAILLRDLETRLRIPPGYILSLRDQGSDWEYIVKLALLVEAAMTEYIVDELGNPKVYDHISNSEQSKRLKLAFELGLITKSDKDLLLTVAEVRNAFAHRVVNLHRTLETYLVELPRDRRKEIAKRILGDEGAAAMRAAKVDLSDWLPSEFRKALINAVVLPLISMSMSRSVKERDKKREAWQAANPSKELARIRFNLPPDPSIQIGPPPNGAPGPGLDLASRSKP